MKNTALCGALAVTAFIIFFVFHRHFANINQPTLTANTPLNSQAPALTSASNTETPPPNKINEKDGVKIPVLMYHNFQEGLKNDGTNVEPSRFETQIKYLTEKGYRGINEEDLTAYFDHKKPLPDKPIMITVDDGYISNYTDAFPILKKYNMKATIFVIVSAVGIKPSKFLHFDWKQAKEMYDSGLVEIQSHTYNLHYKLTGKRPPSALSGKVEVNGKPESDAEREKRIFSDLKLANELIEKNVGNHAVSLAYPYGQYDDTAIKMLKKAGIRFGFTTRKGVTDFAVKENFEIKRLAVRNTDSGEDLLKKIEAEETTSNSIPIKKNA